jgi:hypothetical protein
MKIVRAALCAALTIFIMILLSDQELNLDLADTGSIPVRIHFSIPKNPPILICRWGNAWHWNNATFSDWRFALNDNAPPYSLEVSLHGIVRY